MSGARIKIMWEEQLVHPPIDQMIMWEDLLVHPPIDYTKVWSSSDLPFTNMSSG